MPNNPITCQNADWTFDVDLETGFVRRLKYGNETVALAIYCAVRDADWGTCTPHISQVQASPTSCTWHTQVDGAPFSWDSEARLDADGFHYSAKGVASAPFKTRRTGVCFLHPMELAGTRTTVIHADGSTDEAAFPVHISPHQPFYNLGTFRYSGRYGHSVEIRFAGEVFETEDQRNWTDASFKTYCRPLAAPAPYKRDPSTLLHHQVHVRASGTSNLEHMPHMLTGRFPEWAVWVDGLPDQQIPELAAAGIRRIASDDPSVVHHAEIRRLPVDLRIGLDQISKLHPIQAPAPGSTLWVVSDQWGPPVIAALGLMRRSWAPLGWEVGLSSPHNFTELNRSRPDDGHAEILGFAATPQVHAFDALSILENATTFSAIGATLRTFAGSAKTCAGPIRISSHRVPNDPRARGPLGAAYYALALASICAGRFDRVIIGLASQVLDHRSDAGEVLRTLARNQPVQATLGDNPPLIDVRFQGKTSCGWRLNPTQHVNGDMPPYAMLPLEAPN